MNVYHAWVSEDSPAVEPCYVHNQQEPCSARLQLSEEPASIRQRDERQHIHRRMIMQHLFKVGLSALVMNAALMIACVETEIERADPAQGSAEDPGASDGAPAPASPGESGEANDALGDKAATEDSAAEEVGSAPQALGKECYVTCTVQNLGSGVCPPTVAGYGSTSFLGGCGKACRKAEGDAKSKLPPGCIINSCDRSGC
jgi:hypothetical protein